MSQTKAQLLDTLIASLLPASDSSIDIGSNGVRFANIYGDTLYGDGSNLTGITSTTINNNADNRLITGSGSANTLNGESGLTFDGTTLDLTATSGKITINSTGPAVHFIDTNADSDFMAQTDGGLFKLVDLTNSDATRLVLNSSGKVGINETNPSEMLHIKAEDNTDSFGGLIIKANNNSVHMKYGWRGLDANSGGDIRFAVGGTEMMRVLSSGKVGLGRTSADEMLHIKNDDNTDGFGGIKIDANNGSIQCKYGWLGVDGSNSFRIGVAGTERMRVASDGNVGIGTTSPGSVLHVDKGLSGSPLVTFHQLNGNSSADAGLEVETSSTGTYIQRWVNSASEKMRVTGNGLVGIGTASPTQPIHVLSTTNPGILSRNDSGGTGLRMQSDSGSACSLSFSDLDAHNQGLIMYHHADNRMQFNTNGTEKMRIDSAGNLIIGATSYQNGGFGGTSHGINIAGTQPQILLHETDTDKDGYFGLASSILRIQTADSIPVTIWTNDTKRINVHETTGDTTIETGNLVIGTSGKGIDFSATGGPTNGTGSSELLDDYEEGSWTPAVATGTAGGVGNARYVKIGRVVHVEGGVSNFSDQTSSTAIEITGFPFALTFIENAKFTCSLSRVTQQSTGSGAIVDMLHNTSTAFPGLQSNSASTGTSIRHQDLNHNAASIIFSGTYTTN